MLLLLFSIILFSYKVLAASSITATVPYYVAGCPAPAVVGQGFNVKYYRYPLGSQVGFESSNDGSINPAFYHGNYRNYGGLFATKSGITNINFYDTESRNLARGNVYGVDLTITNFTLELTGFYRAPLDGIYTLYLAADDNVSVQFGRGSACCGDFSSDIVVNEYEYGTNGKSYNDGKSSDWVTLRTNNHKFNLKAGLYYPIRMIYFNALGSHVLQASMLQPDGYNNTDFSNVYQLDTTGHCPIITTVPWTGSYTTDYTKTTVQSSSTVTEIVVQTPAGPGIATTTTRPWTGSFITTSIATGFYTTTSSGLTKTGVVTSYVVETPTAPATATTITTIGTGSVPTTSTTTGPYTITIGSLTETGVVTTVWVETPTAPGTATTITTPGATLKTSTTIGPYTVTSGDLVETGVATTVWVETPTAPGTATTITTPGTTLKTSTTTGPYTVTSDTLIETGVATTVWVETPTAPGTATTITTPGATLKTSTTIGPYTVTSGDLIETGVATTVWVETPTAPGTATTITTPGSTLKTSTTTGPYTVTSGTLIETGVATTVWVETPTAPGTATTISTLGATLKTSTTTGPYTVTSGNLTETGVATTVWVETPTAPGTATTITTPGATLKTSTSTGPYTVTTGTLIETGVATTVWIETPTAPGTSTTITTPGTSLKTSTTTGPYTVTFGNLTEIGVATTVWVETPTAPGTATTITIPGTTPTTFTMTGPYTITSDNLTETGEATTVYVLTQSRVIHVDILKNATSTEARATVVTNITGTCIVANVSTEDQKTSGTTDVINSGIKTATSITLASESNKTASGRPAGTTPRNISRLETQSKPNSGSVMTNSIACRTCSFTNGFSSTVSTLPKSRSVSTTPGSSSPIVSSSNSIIYGIVTKLSTRPDLSKSRRTTPTSKHLSEGGKASSSSVPSWSNPHWVILKSLAASSTNSLLDTRSTIQGPMSVSLNMSSSGTFGSSMGLSYSYSSVRSLGDNKTPIPTNLGHKPSKYSDKGALASSETRGSASEQRSSSISAFGIIITTRTTKPLSANSDSYPTVSVPTQVNLGSRNYYRSSAISVALLALLPVLV